MKNIHFAAVDVDDQAYHVSIFNLENGKGKSFSCKPSANILANKLKEIAPLEDFQVCYEASYIGYSLQNLIAIGYPAKSRKKTLAEGKRHPIKKTNISIKTHLIL